MNDAQLTRWGLRYGVTLPQVKAIALLIETRVEQATHECNGDPHPLVGFAKRADKDACSRMWSQAVAETDKKIEAEAKAAGFDSVDFGTGLAPTFRKAGEHWIDFPTIGD